MIHRVSKKTKGDTTRTAIVLRFLLGLIDKLISAILKSLFAKSMCLTYLRFIIADAIRRIYYASNDFTSNNTFVAFLFGACDTIIAIATREKQCK